MKEKRSDVGALLFPHPTPYTDQLERELLEEIEGAAGKELYRPRLEALRRHLEHDDSPTLPPTRVVIAGTNGKGQVATELAYHLQQHNISHSLFTSPHVLSVTERLSYNGKNVSYGHLQQLLRRVLQRLGRPCPLSFYELLYAAFLEGHRDLAAPAQVMICEVGLGGRWDAVNGVEPTLTAVVSIGRDHTEILGEDLRQILGEKLGVARPRVPLFTTITQPALRDHCAHYCQRQAIPLSDLWSIPDFSDQMEGSYFQRNSVLARALAQQIVDGPVPPLPGGGLLATRGRWQVMDNFTFVGAHNRDGLAALLDDPRTANFDGIIFSLSQRGPEDIQRMVRALARCGPPLYFSRRPHYKKLSPSQWPLCSPPQAQVQAMDSFYPPSPGRFLVTGSNYFIGEFQRAISPC